MLICKGSLRFCLLGRKGTRNPAPKQHRVTRPGPPPRSSLSALAGLLASRLKCPIPPSQCVLRISGPGWTCRLQLRGQRRFRTVFPLPASHPAGTKASSSWGDAGGGVNIWAEPSTEIFRPICVRVASRAAEVAIGASRPAGGLYQASQQGADACPRIGKPVQGRRCPRNGNGATGAADVTGVEELREGAASWPEGPSAARKPALQNVNPRAAVQALVWVHVLPVAPTPALCRQSLQQRRRSRPGSTR